MLNVFRSFRQKHSPSTPLLDALNVTTLREDPELLERVIKDQHQLAVEDPATADFLRTIFLQQDREADFERFEKSAEFATILKLLRLFGVTPDQRLIEIGGGAGFLTWALHRTGFCIDLLEPNALWNTGTGYLKSRKDGAGIAIFNDHLAWHAAPKTYDVLITKNCIHHFQNIVQVAASLRQKLATDGKWFAFREQFADSPKELGEAFANHPFCQKFGLYEWFYPAQYYVESLELTGFRLVAIVPSGYANNCLGTFSEGEESADGRHSTTRLDAQLSRTPEKTVQAFWREVQKNRSGRSEAYIYTRPQVMIFTKI